ncbi:hypothetical protein [Rubrivirga sp. IMCC43871]
MAVRPSTLFESLFVGAPMQHAPVRVAVGTALAALGTLAILASGAL